MDKTHPPVPAVDRPLTDEELRTYLAHYILHRKFNPDLPFQIGEFQHHVGGPNSSEAGQIERSNGGSNVLSNRINQICWEWVRLGLIVPGMQPNAFVATEAGELVLEHSDQEVAPILKSGGIASALAEVGVDDLPTAYADEAQRCFSAGLYQAATVMLGVASEFLVIEMAAVLLQRRRRLGLRNLSPKANVREQIEWLKEAFQEKSPAIRTALVAASASIRWLDDLGGLLAETNAIRLTRNTAGHPSIAQVQRREVFSLLVLFPRLAIALSEMTNELRRIEID